MGTGLGAAAGGMAAGAAVGTVAGPIGAAIGAAVGAIAGGLAGKAVAEQIDPTVEDAYWQETFRTRPYVEHMSSYDDYGPAYRYGVDTYDEYTGTSFDLAEPSLLLEWEQERHGSKLDWDNARHAVRDSWTRINSTQQSNPRDPNSL